MRTLIRFAFILSGKVLARCLYAFDYDWVGEKRFRPKSAGFKDARVGVFLNHTSLFEPIFLATLPVSLLWRLAKSGIIPGADITMSRPLAGRFFRLLSKDSVSITRKRDRTWDDFLDLIRPESLILIAAEGRMKRPGGLDKDGKKMTVRSGIVDVLKRLGYGNAVFCYSAGLHHIHAPGDKFPRFFRRAKIRYEAIDIESYLKSFGEVDPREMRKMIVADLEARRDKYAH